MLALFLPLLPVLTELTGHRILGTLLLAVVYFPIIIGLADLCHRFIELPSIEYGRRFSPRTPRPDNTVLNVASVPPATAGEKKA